MCELIRYGLANDMPRFTMAAKALSAQEKAMHHSAIAAKIDALLESTPRKSLPSTGRFSHEGYSQPFDSNLFYRKRPGKHWISCCFRILSNKPDWILSMSSKNSSCSNLMEWNSATSCF
ncbi:hypothetical protein IM774_11870 [Erysipelotrichaceae bacterium RD49]|nr:hypothetical protein [Erysipelotrichaceae bacterium RD49]